MSIHKFICIGNAYIHTYIKTHTHDCKSSEMIQEIVSDIASVKSEGWMD